VMPATETLLIDKPLAMLREWCVPR